MTAIVYRQSAIKDFLRCGKYYEYKYVLGTSSPATVAQTIGNVVDDAISHNLKQKIDSNTDLTKEEISDAAVTSFNSLIFRTNWEDEDRGEAKDMALALVSLHLEKIAPRIEPESVQEKFTIETDAGYSLTGTIDYTDKRGFVGDTKTASRQTSSRHVITRALQPASYAYAYRILRGRDPTFFRFDVMLKPTARRGPEYKSIQGKVMEEDLEHFFETVKAVDTAIRAGIALPAPETAWWCSQKYCPYFVTCKKL